jgi:hypothetical protein
MTRQVNRMLALLRTIAMKAGFLGRYYERFAIVTAGRSGSTLLHECLQQHPQIEARGEVFGTHYQLDRARRWIRWHRPIAYLDWFVFRFYPKAIRAVGFNVHYYHCQNEKQKLVWEHLAASGCRVVHLKRNLLKVFVSKELAAKYGVWHASSERQLNYMRDASLTIDPHECLDYIRLTEEWRDRVDQLYAPASKIEIWYEDLAVGFDHEIERLEDWLGVDRKPLIPRTIKQVTRPISEIVTNYADLRSALEDSPWKHYCDE